MGQLYKIIKLAAILVITAVIVLFTGSVLLQDKVAGIILKSLNNKISTKFEYKTLRLSFLKRFPKASLDLKNVLIHSSPGIDSFVFKDIDTDTLLFSKSVLIEFRITDIISEIYNIERISLKEGIVNILTDNSGTVNYEISTGTSEKSDLTLNLERINLSGFRANYYNIASNLMIEGSVESGSLRSRISGEHIDFAADVSLMIERFSINSTTISKNTGTYLKLNLHTSDSGISLSDSKITIDKSEFIFNGKISPDNILELSFTGVDIDISGFKKYLPDKYLLKIEDYKPEGVFQISGIINGPLAKTQNPYVSIDFSLEEGRVTYGKSTLNLNKISFDGSFSNGVEREGKTSSLILKNFKAALGTEFYSGSAVIRNFDSLNTEINLKGRIVAPEIRDFFRLKNISTAEGTADLNLIARGTLINRKYITIKDLLNLETEGMLTFTSFSIGFNNDSLLIGNINGRISVSDYIVTDDLQFLFRGQRIALNGSFDNLPEWLAGQPVVLTGSARIGFDNFIPQTFTGLLSSGRSGESLNTAFSFPDNVILDIDFSTDKFSYKSFDAEKVNGTISYRPHLLNFKNLTLNSLDGIISGTGFISQNKNKSVIARGNFTLSKVDIKKTFSAFRDFGQDFIKAGNLEGNLSGSLALLMPMDSLFRPVVKTISAEGKYIISNGALIDFDPVKELSAYINLSELENIHFEQLENDFFIRNNFLYIPQMEVRSSAVDLSVNGKHDFDNNYEYHIKLLLSEILSKKFRKPETGSTEFGVIQDDGIGRTSLLLKIENKGDDVRVSYDLKAAGNQIKNDMTKEKNTLKTILNEEYGWFSKDSAKVVREEPAGKRFKIVWDESEDTEKEVQPADETDENKLKNLFKRR